MELKRVVVTGLGAVTPVGNTPEETWESLLAGKSGAAPITHFDTTLFKTKFACEVKGLNINDWIDRKEARKLDRYTQLAMIAAMQGVKDANIDLEKEDLNNVGVVFGVGIGGIKTFEDEVKYYGTHEENGPKFNPFFIPKMIADIASGQISIHFGFHGPNYTTTSACASSSNALADAFNLIRLGKANIIVSGGAEAAICACGVGGFNAMHALSTRNDDPEHASRPFSASRDGFIMGEGAGCLILEELEHAKARGAKIYAEMVGEGESADAYHITASHPEGLGAKLVMERALADANLKPEDIDYINVHGTSTHVGDISEAKAIKAVFGDAAYKLNISSIKSMTGHLLGAAGAVEAMACVLSVKNDIVPPTINHEEGDDDPELDYNLNFTFNKAQKREVRAALSNTFGFGGHNCCVVFKKYAE
jgi:3-oxoacyl-[acyl-carrier-protein] synthase II